MANSAVAHVPVFGILSYIMRILVPIVSIVYPAAMSFEALESPSPNDDKQWLTYWVVNSVLQLLELYGQSLVAWIPLYHTLKLVFIAWMVLPQFKGALYLYVNIFRPNGLQARQKLYDQFGDQSQYLKGGAIPVKKE